MFNKYLFQELNLNQQKLALWLTKNPQIITKSTITDIAKLNYVSASFITKSLNKLGYAGYKDYKARVIFEQEKQIPKYGKNKYLANLEAKLFSSITRTLQNIDELKIMNLAKLIIQTLGKVYFVGEGFSYLIALDQTRRYTKSGIAVFALQASDCVGYPFQKEDLIILISASGLTTSIHQGYKYLETQKFQTFVISANPYASHFFKNIIFGVVSDSSNRNERELPLNSRIIIFVIFDWIYYHAMKNYQKNAK